MRISRVDDIEKLNQELLANGADIVEGPIAHIYYCVETTLRDCNGFQLVFSA